MSSTNIKGIGLIVDALYQNTLRSSYERRSMQTIAISTQQPLDLVKQVRKVLITMKLLIVEGERRSQKTFWFPGKAVPNQHMIEEVYRRLTDAKAKVVAKRETTGVSLENAIDTLVMLGFTGVLTRSTTNGYVTTTEVVDLSKL